ncbi:hypothetical protein ACIGMX_34985 [Streptomyces aquilus]|uniref:hypothetical protein n=1 Tax=Streptomyces aquilus TaxID=2548456 RepID=UPI0037CE8394
MISTIDLGKHILASADELNLPLTVKQVDQLTTRVAARAALGKQPRIDLTSESNAVLIALASGEDMAETGRRLGLSVDAIKSRRRRLFKALGAANAPHAVAIAVRLGVLNASAGGQS